MPFSTDGRYLEEPDGDVLCCWPDKIAPPQRLQFARIRRSALPLIEQSGQLTPLLLAPADGLAEQIHVVFFPDDLIAGAEFNFHGPRVSRLAFYLMQKTDIPELSFKPLLRRDVLEQLRRLDRLRLFLLKVRTSYVEALSQMDPDLGATLKGALTLGDADTIEISMAVRRKDRSLGNRARSIIDALARRDDIRTDATRFVVKGVDSQTGKVETIDVLSEYFMARKQIIRHDTRTRALDSGSAYSTIEEAYHELRDQLLQAPETDG